MSIVTVSGGAALTIGGTLINQSGAFNPASIPDFRFWYDFSDLTTMWQDAARTMPVTAAGQPIRSMANKFDITGIGGVSAAGEPFAVENPVNGNDVRYELAASDPSPGAGNVHGDFTDNAPTVALIATTPSDVMANGVDSWTGYAVYPVTPSGPSGAARKVAYVGAVTGGNLLGSFGTSGESGEIGIRAGFGAATYRRSPTKTISANANEWIMQTVVVDLSVGGGTVLTWRINGVDDIGNLTATTGIGTGASYHRGISFGRSGPFDWQGRMGEVLVYRGVHSAFQIGQVETYLSGKWNLDP